MSKALTKKELAEHEYRLNILSSMHRWKVTGAMAVWGR